MTHATLPELLRYIKQDSNDYFAKQKLIVDSSTDIADRTFMCPDCGMAWPDVCPCAQPKWKLMDDVVVLNPDYTPQIGYVTRTAFSWFVYPRILRYLRESLNPRFLDTVDSMYMHLRNLENSPFTKWTSYAPQCFIDWRFGTAFMMWWHRGNLAKSIQAEYNLRYFMCFMLSLLGFLDYHFLYLLPFCPLMFVSIVENEKRRLYAKVADERECFSRIVRANRNRSIKYITASCLVLAGIYGLCHAWRGTRDAQGNLAPKSMADIHARDKEENIYSESFTTALPASHDSACADFKDLSRIVTRNLCHASMIYDGEDGMRQATFNAFFICSNVAIMPQHIWTVSDSFKSQFVRHDRTKIGGNFTAYVSWKHSVHIPGTDLCLVWVPNGGDWRDLSCYLPLDRIKNNMFFRLPGILTYRDVEGHVKTSNAGLKYQMTANDIEFYGATYELDFNTFQGLCMAPVVTQTKAPVIGGFHLGGYNGKPGGCCGLLLKRDFDAALEKLKAIPSVMLGMSSGTMPTEQYDKQFLISRDIHPKSPVNFLPPDSNCLVYGSCIGRATYYSKIVKTAISDGVEKVFGVANKWGPPHFHVHPWHTSLSHATNPSIGVEGHYLDWAMDDYLAPIIDLLKKIPELAEQCRPLSRMQNLAGIDGRRFIDAIKRATSIGFPLSGAKKFFIRFLNPDDFDDFQCPVELDEMFWDVANEMKECYRRGERAYAFFKACLKDEATLLEKDKVRVFQGAPMAMQLLIREFYLPIARALSVCPLLAECAVGVNCQGPEWDMLSRYIAQHGEDRILAGDYSKYDLRMPAQLTMSSFQCMIRLAEACGYSDDDLTIMRGIATDVCYPVMAYNGDLIQLFGSNPSGHNLTVYINSIANSLLFRCGFRHVAPEWAQAWTFRDACALATYGDDAKSSVHEKFPMFNHLSFAKFLRDRDMVFTMPDKTSTPTEYMRDADADFLKRRTVWHEALNHSVGALSEDSIFKMLHSGFDDGMAQSVANVDSALREWFYHGKDVYENRRAQMKELASLYNIDGSCSRLGHSYETCVNEWNAKYA
jgi:hypothetical protein